MANYQCRGKKKLWSVRFTIIENGQEVQKRLSKHPKTNEVFLRKKDAEQGYRDFLSIYQEEQKNIQPNKNILDRKFKEVFNEYKTYKQTQVKDSSFYDIMSIFNLHILPFLGEYKIREIDKQMILNWQLTIDHFGFKYKSKIRTLLHNMYKYLFLYYDVDNVVSRVEPFKEPNTVKEMQIWSFEEYCQFINNVDNLMYKTFFEFLYYTGCRKGEILSLSYSDIDLKNKVAKINKSLTTKIYNKTNNENFNITSPKNSTSIRTILLSDNVVNSLSEYITIFPNVKSQKFLFGNNDRPLSKTTLKRKFDEYCEKANVKKIRIHDCRHSHVSLLVNNDANILLIAKRLGHKNIHQTLNTYSHLFPNAEKELMEKLNLK